jgi:hypothetical protein
VEAARVKTVPPRFFRYTFLGDAKKVFVKPNQQIRFIHRFYPLVNKIRDDL